MAKTIGQLTQATTLAGGDEFIIEQSGLTKRVAASVVRGGLINSDIDAAAAIAFSKLAALDSANLLIGNGSNVATKVAVTGDVTISNAGVTAIGSAKVTPTMLTQPLTLATAQATTSGTSIDFTGIPSWVKRITVMFNGVSTDGSSNPLLQIGDGSIRSSGYSSGSRDTTTTTAGSGTGSTAGFVVSSAFAAHVISGHIILTLVSSNTWCSSHTLYLTISGSHYALVGAGISPALSGTLDRVRLTTVNGSDTFDAGSVNIMYEG
jgi:hypothetical protein